MRPVSIPNTFQTKTGQIPLSQLDSNFTTLATAINDLNTGNAYYVDSSGAANQIVVTTPNNVTAVYEAGLAISVQIANTNTATAVTININGQGATALSNLSGTTGVAIGQLTALDIVNLVFDGTSFIVVGGSNLATSTMSMSLAGNFTIPAPTAGVTLTVDGVSGGTSIVGLTPSGASNSITSQTGGGASYAAVSTLVQGISQMSMIANNSGSTVVGIPTASVGIGSPSSLPLVIAVAGAARITLGSATGAATSYNFAGSLLTSSATAGGNGPPPATVAGYWNVEINGASSKIPYYAP